MAGDNRPLNAPDLDRHQMRALRRLREIPQEHLARAIGRSQFYVASIERGTATPTAQEVQVIKELLGLAPQHEKGGKR